MFNVFVWKEKGVHVEGSILCLSEETMFDLLKKTNVKTHRKKNTTMDTSAPTKPNTCQGGVRGRATLL